MFCCSLYECFLVVTLVGTASVSAQPQLPTLRSVIDEGFTSTGDPRSFVVCHTDTSSPSIYHSSCKLRFILIAALQCEKGLVYNPCGPACTLLCPSVHQSSYSHCAVLSCVEGCFCPDGTVTHGKTRVCFTVSVSSYFSEHFSERTCQLCIFYSQADANDCLKPPK